MTQIDLARLVREYADDKQAVRKCAERHGVSIQAVYYQMDRIGLARRRGGDANSGIQARENNPNWQGGTTLRKDGYVLEYIDGKQRSQHRLIMERIIGRALKANEVVHHINGDPADNRIENLELLESQSEHNRRHMTPERARVMQSLSVKAKAALKAREARS